MADVDKALPNVEQEINVPSDVEIAEAEAAEQQELLNLVQEGEELEDIMDKTGMSILEITKAMAAIYEEYKDK